MTKSELGSTLFACVNNEDLDDLVIVYFTNYFKMHILVTNDDGPPSNESSPYILAFVRALEEAGHEVSVILPSEQRSWIGKAHIIGKDVQATYYWPETEEHGSPKSQESKQGKPWVLVNSTPATCSQLGLAHCFKDRKPIDLVVSGP
ncbi:sure-like protein, partial [Aureobasidium melanogenum]